MAGKPWHRGPWFKVRKVILARDRHTCQIKADGCTHKATHVDHIVSPIEGGPWWDEQNLRAACANCNLTRPNPALKVRPQNRRNVAPSKQW